MREVKYDPDVVSWVRSEGPPLDVLMVWHAYMLNPAYVRIRSAICLSAHTLIPRWYTEDSIRLPILQTLERLDDRLLPAVVRSWDRRISHRVAFAQPTR